MGKVIHARRWQLGFALPLLLSILLLPAFLRAQGGIVKDENVWIPLRDGVRLQADVWRPPGDGKFPTLVYRTPYNRRGGQRDDSIYGKAVQRGYAVVMVDVRGRYGSEGEYLPYMQETKDGYDTIEWAAAQPWSNGAVGTFGLSYPGAVQWLAAMECPPHLKAMVPAMTFSTPTNFIYSGGVFDMSWIGWIWTNIAPDVRVKKNLTGPRTGQEARRTFRELREKFLNFLPLSELPELKDVAPWYYDWMKIPPGDKRWDWAELRDKYARADSVAVLNFSGWNDEAYGPEGATTNFNGLLAARKNQKDKRTALVMGPWVHGVPGPDERVAGERDFGANSVIDYDAMVLDWMDLHLKGRGPDCTTSPEAGKFRTPACGKPVRYYVMGPNEWRESDVWPPANARATPFYLGASPDKANLLSTTPFRTGPPSSTFVSDPTNPVPDEFPPYTGGHDYSALAKRKDVLVFDSEPLTEDTEVTGPITAAIFLSVDAPDTDLWVRLLDLGPDGKAINLMSPGLDVIRASYRNGGPKRELLTPGKVYKIELKNLITSNVFKKDHRIRVQISATFFPNFSRNLHTGELEMTSSARRTATIRVHHDNKHRSQIVLPLIPRP